MPVENPGLDVDEAMNSHGPATFGIGATAGILELEQPVKVAATANNRAETTILLMNTRSFYLISATYQRNQMNRSYDVPGFLRRNALQARWKCKRRIMASGKARIC